MILIERHSEMMLGSQQGRRMSKVQYAFFKLEQLKLKHQLNHFALRSKLYLKALQASFAELKRLSA